MRSSLLLLSLLPSGVGLAQNALPPARTLLKLPSSKPALSQTVASPSDVESNSLTAQWRREARALRKMSAKPAAEQARAWLSLAQKRETIPLQNLKTGERRPDFAALVRALPAPDAWPQVLQLARTDYVKAPTQDHATVLYFVARLQNDEAAQVEALRALYRTTFPRFASAVKKYPLAGVKVGAPRDYAFDQKRLEEMSRFSSLAALLRDSPSRAQQKIGVLWQLEIVPRQNNGMQLDVPDLVTLWGEREAVPVVRQILASPASATWYGAGKTSDLARRLWLADTGLRRAPQWGLASSSTDWKFALATLSSFPAPAKNDPNFWNVSNARGIVLGGLVADGQTDQATRLLNRWLQTSASGDIRFSSPQKESPTGELRALRWLESQLRAHPQLSWWDEYRVLSLRLRDTPHRLQLLQKLVGRNGFDALKPAQRRLELEALGAAYLDSDDARRGGDALVRSLQIGLNSKADVSGNVTALLRLTRVVPDAKWMQSAQKGAKAVFAVSDSDGDDSAARTQTQIALRLAGQNQRSFAVSLLAGAYRAQMKAGASHGDFRDPSATRQFLFGLMAIYKSANQPADMVDLLERAPGWGESELTPILTFDGSDQWDFDAENPESKTAPKLGFLAAWALAKQNRRTEAVQILRALLERAGGYDDAYRLLCDLEGEAARPFLQTLAARDPFEERPLIWQAFLSRRTGNSERAFQLAQAAIKIDPSDGEQGRGDRLRAYSELAASLRGENKIGEARKIESAVRAIRLAENADFLRIAGLTNRAITLYERSLRFFDDAYCVQSRLAVQLVGLGRLEEAGAHFRRAFELMPQSFGRLESHCFGCEGVFGGQQNNSIARQVFLQLEKARPNDARIAYLSGYWRNTAGQTREATRYFRRAVALDPQYLSAWKQLSYSTDLTPAQKDRATLRLLELDPRGAHEEYGGVSFEVKRDFRGLWTTTRTVLSRKTSPLRANFRLPASQTEQDWNSYDLWTLVKSPADAIASQAFVRQLTD